MNVPPPSLSGADGTARTIASQALSAVVFREVLKPLAAALGPAGDTMLDAVIDRILVKPKP